MSFEKSDAISRKPLRHLAEKNGKLCIERLRGKTAIEHFMLSNILQTKIRICIDKMYWNKVIENDHMQKIVRFRKRVAILGLFTLFKTCNFKYVDNSSPDRNFKARNISGGPETLRSCGPCWPVYHKAKGRTLLENPKVVFAKSKASITEKLTNGALVIGFIRIILPAVKYHTRLKPGVRQHKYIYIYIYIIWMYMSLS